MRIVILGAGLMARGAAFDFLKNPRIESVLVADSSHEALKALKSRFPDFRLSTASFDANSHDGVQRLLQGVDGVFCAVHYGYNAAFTRAAMAAGAHMVDLGGNNDVVASQLAMSEQAKQAGVIIVPDCGLAPGMVSVLTAWGLRRFLWADTVRIRVGGLPAEPKQPFEYERLFSVEGLINEYVEPPILLRGGKPIIGEPLGDVEEVEFGPPVGMLEAFNTSGGTSTLPKTFAKRLRNLDYKTLRYPGHAKAMQWLLHLGLFSSNPLDFDGHSIVPRHLVAHLIAKNVPLGDRDRTVVRVQFEGTEGGAARMRRLDIIDEFDRSNNLTSMMRMTAFPAAIILQMACDGRVFERGVVPQETAIDSQEFVRELSARGIVIRES